MRPTCLPSSVLCPNRYQLVAAAVLQQVAKRRLHPPVVQINPECEADAGRSQIKLVQADETEFQWNDKSALLEGVPDNDVPVGADSSPPCPGQKFLLAGLCDVD